MNLTEILEPLGGPIAVSDSFQKAVYYNRLVKAGWQIVQGEGCIVVLRPGGSVWRMVTAWGCSCPGWAYRKHCRHFTVGEALAFSLPCWSPKRIRE